MDRSDQGGDRAATCGWFVLQGIDPAMGSPALEARFRVDDVAVLRAALGDLADGRDPDLEWVYPLERAHLDAIEQRFGASIGDGAYEVMLLPWHFTREAPYLNHGGFELPLMLEGRKPFAKFSNVYPDEWFDDVIGRFDPFVQEGRFVRRIVTRPFDEPARWHDGGIVDGFREVYFALPGEEWRIDAYLLLVEVGLKAGWNDALERYEGSLLGYEDWQTDWWLEALRSRRRPQPAHDDDHTRRQGRSLVAAMQSSPYPDLRIEPTRSRLPVRDIDL
ncbi:hypothetical protein [Labrys wisconsinensis]|uniref:Uncharacterized protein n=1 Tax=Labrys wisconsinensis TaxID=425677 RepID=A0ABU0JDT3_9HYPH|nr:hypothetical protein [Labrys wisconsinensis]MDQ0472447.1 hypothetical protein [Labrys wisconsinensis]